MPQTEMIRTLFLLPSLLGDNRDFSRDSRFLGPIPLTDLIGAVGSIVRSMDPKTGEERSARAGSSIY